ncbi:MAG: efflux RND transporter permease subunit, partial [Cyclobacteriaceae bacterium]|nr:efflux RND transporter permease subunit [Cyclobacteriaceae bacterium HetDA_MAG_MS6]
LIKFFIQYPTLVNLFVFLLVGIGLMQLTQIRSTNFPSQKIRFIDIAVPYPGASPSEVEEAIAIKIEENLEGVVGIDRVTSVSKENLATVEVELLEEADPNRLLVEVKNAVDRINNFPDGVEPPSIEKRDPMDITMSFGLVGDMPLQSIKDYGEEIRDDLLSAPGISRVYIEGIPDEEIEVSIRENDLRAYNLSIDQVMMAVRQANLETFGGSIETGTENISIKADSKGYYAKDLKNIVVRADRNGNTIYLKDVAEVVDQFKDQAAGRFFGGEQMIVVNVYTLTTEDILENANFAKTYIDEFNESHSGPTLKILEDGTVNLRNRLKTMIDNGIIGIILVLIVLALFLDRYLATWVALKIPVAIIGMFVVADLYGMTVNVVSLFGFILVLGILVDDGVVIGENIYQHAKEKGKNPLKAALDGAVEMVTPVIISLSTTAVAFSLFLFLPTQAGDFFGEMAFVVIAVLFVALLESFFVLPVHLAHSKGLRKDVKLSKLERGFSTFIAFLRDKVYMPFFQNFVVGKAWMKSITLVGFVVLLFASISLVRVGLVNFTFFPNLDDDAVFIEMELPPGTPTEVVRERLGQIEAGAWKVNERYRQERADGKDVIKFVEQLTGPLDNQGRLKVTFLEGEVRGISSFQLSNEIREASPAIPEATRLIYGLGATSAAFGMPISIAMIGEDIDELRLAKNKLKASMSSRIDIKDVSDNDMQGIQELKVKLKPQAELMGLNLASVMNQIRAGFFGMEAQSLQRGDDEIEIWVRYPKEGRSSVEQLQEMRITDATGNYYLLKDIAFIGRDRGTLSINHVDGQRQIKVEANVAHKNVSAPKVIADIEATVIPDILEQHPSVNYAVEGQNRTSFKMIQTISVVGPLVMLFILALIIVNCNSFSQGFIVFSLFPFALIGVITGHWIHGIPLSIFSLVGTIALIGVFVNNALVFISTLNDLLKEGKGFVESISETARSRFRPILLTTVTTVAGLGPLIASSSLGAQFLKGPAIAIAYGLGFGILNVLVLFPLYLIIINKVRRLWYSLFKRHTLITAEQVEPAVRKLKFIIND